MESLPPCPVCLADLATQDADVVCAEGHQYTATGFVIATNAAVVSALWLAIRALEDDATGLTYMASRTDLQRERVAQLRDQAAEARTAAAKLRKYATAAQRRLDSVPRLRVEA